MIDNITLLGLTAGALTTISFFPQLIKTIKTKSAKDISMGMFIVLACGICLWIVYGFLTRAVPVIIANSATLLFVFVIMILKIRYK